MKENNENYISTGWIALPYIIVILLFIIFISSLIFFIWPIDLVSLANAGMLGDSFGALNTLFSGLALASLIAALHYQQKQIKLQQAELSTTQAELKKQTEVFDQQKFDETFFQLLKLLRENLNSLRHKDNDGEEWTGIDLIQNRLKKYKVEIKNAKLGKFPHGENEKIIYAWEFLKISKNSLGRQRRYIDTLGVLVEWTESNCPPSSNRKHYQEIISSQLTHIECNYIFYQILLSPEAHPLRKLLGANNPIFQKVSQSNPSTEHRKILSWITKAEVDLYKKSERPPIRASAVSKAKRRISATTGSYSLSNCGNRSLMASQNIQHTGSDPCAFH